MINKILEFIQAREISKYRFMKDTGIAQRTAYDLCNNPIQLPSPDVLRKICDAYQIQPSEILEWLPPDVFKAKFPEAQINNESIGQTDD